MHKVKARVLVADRNGNLRNFLKREMSSRGYDVILAQDGRELMKEMQSPVPPDVLIMDLLMPYLDGFLVLERLKKSECKVPIIIYTSLCEYRNDPAVIHAKAFLDKDSDPEVLMQTVNSVLSADNGRPAMLSR